MVNIHKPVIDAKEQVEKFAQWLQFGNVDITGQSLDVNHTQLFLDVLNEKFSIKPSDYPFKKRKFETPVLYKGFMEIVRKHMPINNPEEELKNPEIYTDTYMNQFVMRLQSLPFNVDGQSMDYLSARLLIMGKKGFARAYDGGYKCIFYQFDFEKRIKLLKKHPDLFEFRTDLVNKLDQYTLTSLFEDPTNCKDDLFMDAALIGPELLFEAILCFKDHFLQICRYHEYDLRLISCYYSEDQKKSLGYLLLSHNLKISRSPAVFHYECIDLVDSLNNYFLNGGNERYLYQFIHPFDTYQRDLTTLYWYRSFEADISEMHLPVTQTLLLQLCLDEILIDPAILVNEFENMSLDYKKIFIETVLLDESNLNPILVQDSEFVIALLECLKVSENPFSCIYSLVLEVLLNVKNNGQEILSSEEKISAWLDCHRKNTQLNQEWLLEKIFFNRHVFNFLISSYTKEFHDFLLHELRTVSAEFAVKLILNNERLIKKIIKKNLSSGSLDPLFFQLFSLLYHKWKADFDDQEVLARLYSYAIIKDDLSNLFLFQMPCFYQGAWIESQDLIAFNFLFLNELCKPKSKFDFKELAVCLKKAQNVPNKLPIAFKNQLLIEDDFTNYIFDNCLDTLIELHQHKLLEDAEFFQFALKLPLPFFYDLSETLAADHLTLPRLNRLKKTISFDSTLFYSSIEENINFYSKKSKELLGNFLNTALKKSFSCNGLYIRCLSYDIPFHFKDNPDLVSLVYESLSNDILPYVCHDRTFDIGRIMSVSFEDKIIQFLPKIHPLLKDRFLARFREWFSINPSLVSSINALMLNWPIGIKKSISLIKEIEDESSLFMTKYQELKILCENHQEIPSCVFLKDFYNQLMPKFQFAISLNEILNTLSTEEVEDPITNEVIDEHSQLIALSDKVILLNSTIAKLDGKNPYTRQSLVTNPLNAAQIQKISDGLARLKIALNNLKQDIEAHLTKYAQ
jgi:hypothetical protein